MESMLVSNMFHNLPSGMHCHRLGHRWSCRIAWSKMMRCILVPHCHIEHKGSQPSKRLNRAQRALDIAGLCWRIRGSTRWDEHTRCPIGEIASGVPLWQCEIEALMQLRLLQTKDGLHVFYMHNMLFSLDVSKHLSRNIARRSSPSHSHHTRQAASFWRRRRVRSWCIQFRVFAKWQRPRPGGICQS